MFLRHPAWLWLKKYDKTKIPIPDEDLQARFDEGTLFEEYAEKLFPNAVRLGYKNGKDFSGSKYYGLPELTKKEIEQGTKVIMQGRLEVDNLTAIFDVLERVEGKTFDLYEIKSSTSVKPEHIPDLAFQTIVLEKAGLTIRNLSVLHVNNEYVRNGDIEPEKISKKTDVTEDVRVAIDETLEHIEKAFVVLSNKVRPDLSPRYLRSGGLNEWLPIYEAVKGKLPEYSIYKLCTLKPETVALLEDLGIELINNIPLDFKLSEKQLNQVIATKTGEQKIAQEEIREFIDSLEFPIHFFDYETVSGVIPAFDGVRPYQQVPFQYSLHILPALGGELIHKEYLHTEKSNPVPALLKQMQEDFEGKGSIIAWSKKFEVARNNEMAKMYPVYEKFLLGLNDRMVDLMDPFSKGWFVDKGFFGSASLKAVLPVLFPDTPELSYDELVVSHGGQAQRVWMETVLAGKNIEKKDEIMEHLRKYCALDTYSMYAVLKYLSNKFKMS